MHKPFPDDIVRCAIKLWIVQSEYAQCATPLYLYNLTIYDLSTYDIPYQNKTRPMKMLIQNTPHNHNSSKSYIYSLQVNYPSPPAQPSPKISANLEPSPV
jgi:hypothetical protein